MQVAGHVLWPRAAWLYHGATLLMTLSFLVSGGLVTLGRQKLPFYDIILVRGGLASRATGLGPEGPPSAKVPMGPFCAGRKIFKWLILDELSDSDKTTSFNQRKIG